MTRDGSETSGSGSTLPSSRARVQQERVSSPLSPLGERVDRNRRIHQPVRAG